MLSEIDAHGRLSLAQLLFNMTRTDRDLDDDVLHVLAPIEGVAEADRLRGGVYARRGRPDEARLCFERGMHLGDRYSQAYLVQLLIAEYPEDPRIGDLENDLVVRAERDEADAAGALARLAASGGQPEVAASLRLLAAELGDWIAERDLRSIEASKDFARARALVRPRAEDGDGWACLFMAGTDYSLDGAERDMWLRRGSEVGEAQCVAWLASSEDPEVAYPAQALLRSWGLPEELHPLLPSDYLAPLNLLREFHSQTGRSAYEAGDRLNALRSWRHGAAIGDAASAHNLGLLLKESDANPKGAWAMLGSYIALGPGRGLVGGEDAPLDWIDVSQFDHREAAGWESPSQSRLAARVVDYLVAAGANVSQMGTHAFAGWWGSSHRALVHFTFTVDGAGQEWAWVFTPLIVESPPGLDAPWGVLPVVDEDLRLGLLPEGPSGFGTPSAVMSRFLEALFRLGEDDSRQSRVEEPMGWMGMTIGGMTGRTLTFPDTPEEFYPRPFYSVGPSHTLVDGAASVAFPLEDPLQQITVGYVISGELSDSALAGAVAGAVDSISWMAEVAGNAFLEAPATFAEFVHGVPVSLVPTYPHLFEPLVGSEDALEREADAADPGSLVDRGISAYLSFVIVGTSFDRAVEDARGLWLQAESSGDPGGGAFLAAIAEEQDFQSVLTLAAQRGHPDAIALQVVLDPQLNDPLEKTRLLQWAASAGSHFAMCQLGNLASEEGDEGAALRWWHASVAPNQPSGLASILWHCVLNGDVDQGNEWFSQYGKVVLNEAPGDQLIARGGEWANLFSNYALITRARTDDEDAQLSEGIWTLCFQAGHLEAGLYLMISQSLTGERPDAGEVLGEFGNEQREEWITMVDVVLARTTSTWTRAWFSHGHALLGSP